MSCKKCGFITASATTYPYGEDVWQCPSCGYLQGKAVENVSRIIGKAIINNLSNSNGK